MRRLARATERLTLSVVTCISVAHSVIRRESAATFSGGKFIMSRLHDLIANDSCRYSIYTNFLGLLIIVSLLQQGRHLRREVSGTAFAAAVS